MIKYNELRISGDYLIYDLDIENLPYYKGIGIWALDIDIPSFYKKGQKYKTYRLPLSLETHIKGSILISDIKKELIKVTPVINEWVPPSDIPCGKDVVNSAIVYDKNIVFDKALPYIKELKNTCSTPKGFIDYILRNKALDLFIKTCNYDEAIRYWEMFNYTVNTDARKCGCAG